MSLDARVGIVLVSHSAQLAEGAAALAAQISGGTVAIIPAGGTDEGQLGTSAAKVLKLFSRWEATERSGGFGEPQRALDRVGEQ